MASKSQISCCLMLRSSIDDELTTDLMLEIMMIYRLCRLGPLLQGPPKTVLPREFERAAPARATTLSKS